MSLHKSLASGSKLNRTRSVLTRIERIQKLTEEGRYVEGHTKVYGLPKVRTSAPKKVKAKKAEAAPAAGGAAAAPAAAAAKKK